MELVSIRCTLEGMGIFVSLVKHKISKIIMYLFCFYGNRFLHFYTNIGIKHVFPSYAALTLAGFPREVLKTEAECTEKTCSLAIIA